MRRNIAKVSAAEREAFRDAILQLNSTNYPDGTSFWDKQDAIHQATHVHGGPAFLPWHRELCNRFEELLQSVDSSLYLHYWDWTTDPTNSPDGSGGSVNLFSTGPNGFMGSASGQAGPPLQDFPVTRFLTGGVPSVPSDSTILTSANGFAPANQYREFRRSLEAAHDYIHGYIGGTIGNGHTAFEDPFVFLLHSNVDRLFSCWQRASGYAWRLDPNQVYGVEGSDPAILENMEPWAGGSGLRPWAPPENQQVSKTSKHPTVVAPPQYDVCRPVIVVKKLLDDSGGGGKRKFLDDPITLKFRDDGGFKKIVDDPITLKFRDDGGPKKIVDDPIKSQIKDVTKNPIEEVKFGGRDVQEWDPSIVEQPGGGETPFALLTSHHSMAWMGAAQPSNETEAEIMMLEQQLDQIEAVLTTGVAQLGALQAEYDALLKRHGELTKGMSGEPDPGQEKPGGGESSQ